MSKTCNYCTDPIQETDIDEMVEADGEFYHADCYECLLEEEREADEKGDEE